MEISRPPEQKNWWGWLWITWSSWEGRILTPEVSMRGVPEGPTPAGRSGYPGEPGLSLLDVPPLLQCPARMSVSINRWPWCHRQTVLAIQTFLPCLSSGDSEWEVTPFPCASQCHGLQIKPTKGGTSFALCPQGPWNSLPKEVGLATSMKRLDKKRMRSEPAEVAAGKRAKGATSLSHKSLALAPRCQGGGEGGVLVGDGLLSWLAD